MRDFIASESIGDLDMLAQVRATLDVLLTDHVQAETLAVRSILAHDSRSSMIALSRRVSEGLAEWILRYRAVRDEWPLDAIRADWVGYRVEAAEVLDQLFGRLAWEENDLYPAVIQIAATAATLQPSRH